MQLEILELKRTNQDLQEHSYGLSE